MVPRGAGVPWVPRPDLAAVLAAGGGGDQQAAGPRQAPPALRREGRPRGESRRPRPQERRVLLQEQHQERRRPLSNIALEVAKFSSLVKFISKDAGIKTSINQMFDEVALPCPTLPCPAPPRPSPLPQEPALLRLLPALLAAPLPMGPQRALVPPHGDIARAAGRDWGSYLRPDKYNL
jgi:hypothetical protein